MSFEPGQRVGDYEIVAKLGAGGLGAVYEVQHLISRRREAMKIMLPDQGTPEMVERFHREVQTLASLNHVNIAQLHTAFYHDNQLVMVMELIHGENLRDLRLRMGVTMRQALDYMEQTLKALAYAHRLGVVHRDIKPSNIMITGGGFVKLLDFGIALTPQGSDLTRSGSLLGSLNYMSPEQIGGSKATSRSDIYSVGITLYELLTGTLPIKGESNYEIMMGHMQQVPAPLNQLAPEVPGVVADAVMHALAKDPAERFASAEDFLHSLRLTSTSIETGNTYIGPFPVSLTASARTPIPSAADMPRPGTSSGAPVAAQVSGTQLASPPLQTKSGSSSGFQNLSLEEISRKLAAYIGPVAKFVVKKLAAQSEDPDFIYREAAKEIPSETDRAAFLRSRRI